jgi:hypothetical protein
LDIVSWVKEKKGKIFVTFYCNENLLLCFHNNEKYHVKFSWWSNFCKFSIDKNENVILHLRIAHSSCLWLESTNVATLALGSRPKQGLTKVRAKNEAHESHFMLSGVGECEGMNLHILKWAPTLGVEILIGFLNI